MSMRWLVVTVTMLGMVEGVFAATAPTALELETQAFDWMGKGNYPKARTLIDRAYSLTPAAQRNRALILNRAILDVTQKSLVMRGLKELSTYLIARPEADEEATNILAGGLNVAAGDPALMNGALWQSAYKEWNRRNEELEKHRPGFRRWGVEWVSEDEYGKIQASREALKQAVMDQQAKVNAAATQAQDLLSQQQAAIQNRDQYANVWNYLNYNRADPRQTWNQGGFTGNSSFFNAYVVADQQLRVLGPQVQAALQQYDTEVRALRDLQAKVIRPQWPTKFEAVDPNGPEAVDPPVMVATTQPATTGVAAGAVAPAIVAPAAPATSSGQPVHSTTGPIEPLLPAEKPKGVFGK